MAAKRKKESFPKKGQTISPILAPDPIYAGNYIAMRSFIDRTIIAFGKDHDTVYERATAQGVQLPVMFYIPPKDAINIY